MIDRGFSAFHGVHKTKGALGQFLDLVEAGKIPAGSILLIENIDRLSREDMATALGTVLGIIEHDITIQVLTPSEVALLFPCSA